MIAAECGEEKGCPEYLCRMHAAEAEVYQAVLEKWKMAVWMLLLNTWNRFIYIVQKQMIFLLMKRKKGKVIKSVADMPFDRFFTCNATFPDD